MMSWQGFLLLLSVAALIVAVVSMRPAGYHQEMFERTPDPEERECAEEKEEYFGNISLISTIIAGILTGFASSSWFAGLLAAIAVFKVGCMAYKRGRQEYRYSHNLSPIQP